MGEATALMLAKRGAKVVIGARGLDRLEALARRIAGVGHEVFCKGPGLVAFVTTTKSSLFRLQANSYLKTDYKFREDADQWLRELFELFQHVQCAISDSRGFFVNIPLCSMSIDGVPSKVERNANDAGGNSGESDIQRQPLPI
jgi:NAD(P)-dependent dehydrogenase (short-subunit alcohol dehydrogenase family)